MLILSVPENLNVNNHDIYIRCKFTIKGLCCMAKKHTSHVIKSDWIKQKMDFNSDTEIPVPGKKLLSQAFSILICFRSLSNISPKKFTFFLVMVLMGCNHFELTISNMCYIYVLFSFLKGNSISMEKIKVKKSQIEQTVVTFLVFMEFMFTFRSNRTI